jgi:hypothetical protein
MGTSIVASVDASPISKFTEHGLDLVALAVKDTVVADATDGRDIMDRVGRRHAGPGAVPGSRYSAPVMPIPPVSAPTGPPLRASDFRCCR